VTTEEPVLLRELRGRVLVATLNRPAKGNAMNRAVVAALAALTEDLADAPGSDDVRAVVITGSGTKAFCAGADVTELLGLDHAAAYAQMRAGQIALNNIERLDIPVIAAINGFALGGGLELAMAADLRIATAGAMLGQPEIRLGNLPGWGGTQRLPRLVGRARATELILTGDTVPATRALDWGLVNRLADDALAEALALAEGIAEKNPVAVRGAKEAIRLGLDQGMDHGLVTEAERVADCCQSEHQRWAVQEFLQRRAGGR